MAKSKQKIKALPEQFDNIEAAAEFWNTHSLTDYEDLQRDMEFDVELKSGKNYFVIDKEFSRDIDELAQSEGILPETLVNLWLKEKVLEKRIQGKLRAVIKWPNIWLLHALWLVPEKNFTFFGLSTMKPHILLRWLQHSSIQRLKYREARIRSNGGCCLFRDFFRTGEKNRGNRTGINADYDSDGHLIGIEVLSVSRRNLSETFDKVA